MPDGGFIPDFAKKLGLFLKGQPREEPPKYTVRIINHRQSREGGRSSDTTLVNRQRFWLGRGRKLLVKAWIGMTVKDIIGADDDKIVFISEDPGQLTALETNIVQHRTIPDKDVRAKIDLDLRIAYEPTFHRRSANTQGRDPGRTFDWVLPGNKKYLGPQGKGPNKKHEGFVWPSREQPPPPETWEHRNTEQRLPIEKVSTPPEVWKGERGTPISQRDLIAYIIEGLQLPEKENRLPPPNHKRQHAGFASGPNHTGPKNTMRTLLATKRRLIQKGIWGNFAINKEEKGGEARIQAERIQYVDALLFMASYGHDILGRLKDIVARDDLADHRAFIANKRVLRKNARLIDPTDVRTKLTSPQLSPDAQNILFVLFDGNSSTSHNSRDIFIRSGSLYYRLMPPNTKVVYVQYDEYEARTLPDENEYWIGGRRADKSALSRGLKEVMRYIDQDLRAENCYFHLVHAFSRQPNQADLPEAVRVFEKEILPVFQQVFCIKAGAIGTLSDGGTPPMEALGKIKNPNFHLSEILAPDQILPQFAKHFSAPRVPEAPKPTAPEAEAGPKPK